MILCYSPKDKLIFLLPPLALEVSVSCRVTEPGTQCLAQRHSSKADVWALNSLHYAPTEKCGKNVDNYFLNLFFSKELRKNYKDQNHISSFTPETGHSISLTTVWSTFGSSLEVLHAWLIFKVIYNSVNSSLMFDLPWNVPFSSLFIYYLVQLLITVCIYILVFILDFVFTVKRLSVSLKVPKWFIIFVIIVVYQIHKLLISAKHQNLKAARTWEAKFIWLQHAVWYPFSVCNCISFELFIFLIALSTNAA